MKLREFKQLELQRLEQRKISIELKIKPVSSKGHREQALKDCLQAFSVLVEGPENHVGNSRRFERSLDTVQRLKRIPDFVGFVKVWINEQLERKLNTSKELVLSNAVSPRSSSSCNPQSLG